MTKNQEIKEQRKIITVILTITGVILLLSGIFVFDYRSGAILKSAGFALFIAAVIFRLFNGSFGYKPTREEMEEKIFGK